MRALAAAITALVCTVASTATATTYTGIDQFMGGDVTLALDLWDSAFVVGPDYHVHRMDWSVTNNGPNTYSDVKLVNPFAWLKVDGAIDEYDYVNGSGDWHWTDPADDFVLKPDTSVYVPASAAMSYVLMSDTDLPLSFDWGGQIPTVLSTDSVPMWDVVAALGPGETATFTVYFEQETDSRVTGIWVQPYTVAVIPEPATLALVSVGALALLLRRRKR